VFHRQGQDFLELGFLQGEGVEEGFVPAGGEPPGQHPGIGAVQDEGQVRHFLDCVHEKGHPVLKARGQVAGIEVQHPGSGRGAAPGQILKRLGIEVAQGPGYQGMGPGEVIRHQEHQAWFAA